MKKQPRILLFTGNGKGKPTAALGMVLRASGHGLRVLVLQFIKDGVGTGEIRALRGLPNVEVEVHGLGFLPPRSLYDLAAHRVAAQHGLERAAAALAAGQYEMLVLDEICLAVAKGLLDEREVIDLVTAAPAACTVVLTGRGASKELKAVADTVTEMRCVKHGMQKRIPAQKGVEF